MRQSLSLSLVIALALGCRTPKNSEDGEVGTDTGLDLGSVDVDGDGYMADEDCDDEDGIIHPNAVEVCDGIDNDCDGVVDEDVTTAYYADTDGDGFGDSGILVESCEAPEGHVPNGNDCDDTAAITYPGAAEACDGEDNDCDSVIDEDIQDVWYADTDGDGFGDPGSPVKDCNPGPGYAASSDDCDDGAAEINPAAEEVCDGLDNNCDSQVDEGVTTTFYADTDGDGFGDADEPTEACSPPVGYVRDATDCDDQDGTTYVGAAELCDEVDNSCDGTVDEGVTSTFYADRDLDGYGDDGDTTEGCTPPPGYVIPGGDCDDRESDANPGETEVCDTIDNDCDSQVDEGVTTTFYADDDGDGYGDSGDTTDACAAPSGTTTDASDCDDTEARINPAGAESCDYVDEDCDGSTDEDFRTGSRYTALNHCGYCGNDCEAYGYQNATPSCDASSSSTPTCDFSCDTGYYDANGDSADGCECSYVSAEDVPFDGLDADCDGSDGDHGDAIHVSVEAGSPTGTGSLSDPVDSLQAGIDLAASGGYSYVLVAEGVYEESVTIEPDMAIYGGFDVDFEERDVASFETTIEGAGGLPAVTAVGITSETLLDGFTIEGHTDGTSGSSAVAVYLEDCTDALSVSSNTIWAEDGEDGDDGDGGDDGDDGDDGADGLDGGYDTCASSRGGGAGGVSSCEGTMVDGGDGGDAACPSYGAYQGDGSDGSGADPGVAGTGTCDGYISGSDSCSECYIVTSCWDNGASGTDGGDGEDGDGGGGGSGYGAIVGGMWVADAGDDGESGIMGSGGGGGGAGSGAEVNACSTSSHAGGTGGGGGAGGCGGEGATGGEGGGSSFGVLLVCSTSAACSTLPTLSDNDITAGDGGSGGDGGVGGDRGKGGSGGNGGEADRATGWCALDGGDGGDGGNGGAGGGGGGGAGGLSYAVYAVDITPDSSWVSADNTLDYGKAGKAGSGGAGGAYSNDGSDGVSGSAGEQSW